MGGSWASLGASRPPFGTFLASPLAIKILPESILWLPFVPKDLPREPKRAPGPPRDAFGDDFVLIFRCPEALQCALLRPTCALEIARSKRTCFRLCLHSTAILNAHLKCFNSSPTIANQQYPSPSKGAGGDSGSAGSISIFSFFYPPRLCRVTEYRLWF